MRRNSHVAALASIGILFGTLLAASDARAVNNPYGAHIFLQDYMPPADVSNHLTWARRLTSANGYMKQLIYPITNSTSGPSASWVNFVQVCYDKRLIPVLRIATTIQNGVWVKPVADAPGDYTSFANAVKRVIQGLPLDATLPLYVEVLNEPNNNGEWSGQTNPAEYAQVLEDVAAALHSIDPRVKVTNSGLSPGGDYDNRQFIRAMFTAVPNLGQSIDAWASHPYCGDTPPEQNNHNGNAPVPLLAIDSFSLELAVLSEYMDISNLKVIATEGGFSGVDEDTEAAYMMRAFRDYWSQWPEVLGICPWYFCNPLSDGSGPDWVYPDSDTLGDGYPTLRKRKYETVAALAKPGDTTGAISGNVTEAAFDTPLTNVQVTCNPGSLTTTTDTAGTYFFAQLAPGTYTVSFTRAGFEPLTLANLSVAAAANTVGNASLTAAGTGTIHGIVSDPLTGAPLVGAILTTNPGSYTDATAADGTYTLANLPPGTYDLTATVRGRYDHRRQGLVVEVGGNVAANFSPGCDDFPDAQEMFGGLTLDDNGNIPGVASSWSNPSGTAMPSIFAVDSTVRYSGHGSQRITVGDPTNNYIWNITNYSAIAPGAVYLFEAWVKTQNLVRGSGRGAVLAINFYANDMTFKGQVFSPVAFEGTQDWGRLHRVAIAPAGSARAQVVLLAEGTSGTAWFDNAYLGLATSGSSTSPGSFLQAGGNLVSIPLRPSRHHATEVFGACLVGGATLDDNIHRYLSGFYETYPQDFTLIHPGTGYWLNLDNGCNRTISGVVNGREQYVPLHEGWTLAGMPFTSSRSLAGCEVVADGLSYPLAELPNNWIQKTLVTHHSSLGYQIVKTGPGGDATVLAPWYAYWVRAFRPGLTLVVPVSEPASPPTLPDLAVSRVRLTMTAAGCRPWSYRADLAVTAEDSIDEYDVLAPPDPPTGATEVRLTSDAGADPALEDARPTPSAGASRVWPLSARGVNFSAGQCRTATLTWDAAAANEYAWCLVNTATGRIDCLNASGQTLFDVCEGATVPLQLWARYGHLGFGDVDEDGDVDPDDFDVFQACATGPGLAYDAQNLASGCTLVADGQGVIAVDFDRDGDVDLSDFGTFQRCLSGAGVWANPSCGE